MADETEDSAPQTAAPARTPRERKVAASRTVVNNHTTTTVQAVAPKGAEPEAAPRRAKKIYTFVTTKGDPMALTERGHLKLVSEEQWLTLPEFYLPMLIPNNRIRLVAPDFIGIIDHVELEFNRADAGVHRFRIAVRTVRKTTPPK